MQIVNKLFPVCREISCMSPSPDWSFSTVRKSSNDERLKSPPVDDKHEAICGPMDNITTSSSLPCLHDNSRQKTTQMTTCNRVHDKTESQPGRPTPKKTTILSFHYNLGQQPGGRPTPNNKVSTGSTTHQTVVSTTNNFC